MINSDSNTPLTLQEKKVAKYRCENDLLFFTRYFHKLLSGEKFIVEALHEEICNALMQVVEGDIQNLVINVPPRYGKTLLAVIMFIAWCVARNPKAKFIHLSYSDELALDNSQKVREIVLSDEFQEFWPIQLKADSKSKKKWYTEGSGGVYASAAGGAITGFGAGHTTTDEADTFGGAIIIDDPLKADDAMSMIERNKVNERLNSTIKSRRNSRNTPIIIIMQRLHEDDMTGFVLNDGIGEEFTHLKLSAIKKDGTALWPLKHSVPELLRMKQTAPYVFSGQYMQDPAPSDGGIFKRDDFKLWPARKRLPEFEYIVQSWDTAFTEKTENDLTAFTAWGVFPIGNDGAYGALLLDCWAKHLEYPELRVTALAEYKTLYGNDDGKWADIVLIEEKGSGIVLCQDLIRAGVPVNPYNPGRADKIQRAHAVTYLFHNGLVYLPESDKFPNRPMSWTDDLVNQLCTFPRASKDDYVDSTVQSMALLRDQSWLSIDKMPDDYEEPAALTLDSITKTLRRS